MFNQEFIARVMEAYGCNQLIVDREGKTYAQMPHGQVLIPGFIFDTITMDGSLTDAIIENANDESEKLKEVNKSFIERLFGRS